MARLNRSIAAGMFSVLSVMGLSVIGSTTGCGAETPEPKVPVVATTTPPVPEPPAPPKEPTVAELKSDAKAAMAAKNWAKARESLGLATAREPSDVESHKWLAESYAAEGDVRGATEAYFAAAKADGGKDEELGLTSAKSLRDQGRWDDVLVVSGLVAKQHDKSQPAWLHFGLAQTARGDYAGATETFTHMTKAWPDEPHLWARLAVAQANVGKADDAKKTAKTALEHFANARAAKSTKDVKLGKGATEVAMIARALRRAGDPTAALAALGKFTVPKDERSPELDIERGFAKRAKKDAKGAAIEADRALRGEGGGYAPGHLLLAALAIDSKKTDEARIRIADFDKYSGIDTTYAPDRKVLSDALSSPAASIATTTGGGGGGATGVGGGAPAKTTPAPAAAPKKK